MTVEGSGVDHIFVSVGDLGRSKEFHDRVMAVLGFRKGEGTIGGDLHLFYYNRQFAYSLRPAREGVPGPVREVRRRGSQKAGDTLLLARREVRQLQRLSLHRRPDGASVVRQVA